MAQVNKARKRIAAPDLVFFRGVQARINGMTAVRVAQAVFDTAGVDSSGAANTTIAAHGLGVYLPDNANIVGGWYEVLTTFTSATDAATIAAKSEGAGDLRAAVAISNAANPWDAGFHGLLPGNYALDGNAMTAIAMMDARAASFIKLSAEREITLTVAVEALTAGKLVVYVMYTLGD